MLDELSIEIREATTRYMQITCKDKATKQAFDLTGYDVQTWISFGSNQRYVPTVVVGSLVSYEIPAEMSLGTRRGVAETRIFKDGDVFEVLRVNITVYNAVRPDLEHHAPDELGGTENET